MAPHVVAATHAHLTLHTNPHHRGFQLHLPCHNRRERCMLSSLVPTLVIHSSMTIGRLATADSRARQAVQPRRRGTCPYQRLAAARKVRPHRHKYRRQPQHRHQHKHRHRHQVDTVHRHPSPNWRPTPQLRRHQCRRRSYTACGVRC